MTTRSSAVATRQTPGLGIEHAERDGATPFGDGGHGHHDLLSVEVAADGRPLLVDPGPYSGSEQGRLLEHLRGPGLDLLHGEASSPAPEVVHTRRVLFAFDEYWILEDRLRGTRPHRYALRFHLTPDDAESATLTRAEEGTLVRTGGVSLAVWPRGQSRLESGWGAARYGGNRRAPVVTIALPAAAEAVFLTVVAPSPSGSGAPSLRVVEADPDPRRRVTLEITGVGPGGGLTDRVCWTGSGGPFLLAPFAGQAAVAALRADEDGRLLRFAACGVASVTDGPSGGLAMAPAGILADWVTWDPHNGFDRAGP